MTRCCARRCSCTSPFVVTTGSSPARSLSSCAGSQLTRGPVPRRSSRNSTDGLPRAALSPCPGRTPGFEAYYLVDAGNGVVVSISLFGDRDAAEESTRGAAEWVSRNLADLIRLPPQVLTGEVVAQRTTEHPPLAGWSRSPPLAVA